MKCSDARVLMSQWLDRRVADDEVSAVRSHLALCPACRSHWQAMQHLSLLLQQADVATPPPRFTARVMHRIQESTWRAQAARPVPLAMAWTAALVVLAVAGLVSGIGAPNVIGADSPTFDLLGLSMAVSAAAIQMAKLADILVSVTGHVLGLLPRPLLVLGLLWTMTGITALTFILIHLVSAYSRSRVAAQARSRRRIG